jgi:hypothetical protein
MIGRFSAVGWLNGRLARDGRTCVGEVELSEKCTNGLEVFGLRIRLKLMICYGNELAEASSDDAASENAEVAGILDRGQIANASEYRLLLNHGNEISASGWLTNKGERFGSSPRHRPEAATAR